MVCLLQKFYFTSHEMEIGKLGETVILACEALVERKVTERGLGEEGRGGGVGVGEWCGRPLSPLSLHISSLASHSLYAPCSTREPVLTGHHDLRNSNFLRLKMSCSRGIKYLSSRSLSNSVCFLPNSVCSTSMLSCNSLFADSNLSN